METEDMKDISKKRKIKINTEEENTDPIRDGQAAVQAREMRDMR